MTPIQFRAGNRVRYVGHPGHFAAEVVEGLEGNICGHIVEELGGDLYWVHFEGLPLPRVQLHGDQLERA